MIRLTLILCAALFGVMMVAGENRGQLRFGLMAKSPASPPVLRPSAPLKPVIVALPQPVAAPKPAHVVNAAFTPKAPLMQPSQPQELSVIAPEKPLAGRVLRVKTRALNVRAGPGTDYSVVGQLLRGEEVSVVVEDDGPDGWAMIRIEGDGVEGYVATRLLTE